MEMVMLLCFLCGAMAADWSYKGDYGTNSWSVDNPSCSGRRQSPIDIPSADNPRLQYSADLGQLAFVGYGNTTGRKLTLTNNGHTAVIGIGSTTGSAGMPILSGGGLPGNYTAVQFHLHWGQTDGEGSEHTFRGLKYPLELHVVHMKTSYGTLTEAIKHDDGLAVLGFFYTLSDDPNSKLDPLIAALAQVPFKGDSVDVNINVDDVMPNTRTEFYRYEGSLTTPGCDEVVIWTVFENKNYISSEQLDQFRQLYVGKVEAEEYQLEFNYRPPQDLYGRVVYKNYLTEVPLSYHWGYEGYQGADSWQHYYPTCRGQMQSPIDIPAPGDAKMARFDPSLRLDTLQFNNYNTEVTGTLTNNGHTVQLNIENSDISISAGGLDGRYQAAQFHFHWGHDDHHGSEHTREGTAYPLELHIVHYKEEYKSLSYAVNKDDGLAVIAFFFEIDSEHNPGLAGLVNKLRDITYAGLTARLEGFSLEDLTIDNLRQNATHGRHVPYFRYTGGLTTPPCFQIVTWTIMKETVKISAAQMAEFRKLVHVTEEEHYEGHSGLILENYRPTQRLHTRRVFSSERMTEPETSGSSTIHSCVTAYVIVGLVVHILTSMMAIRSQHDEF